ncbi:MAG: amidohydrolase [Candidatus Rokuibacteriota bacterium]|nr:MAG: amidohydrolase [Candidatus Rokubacteria bacterium]
MKTLIHGGDLVAYDQGRFVGARYDGVLDARVDATGKLVIPGLVNIHCHPTTEAGGRLVADVGRRDFFQTGFLNYTATPKGVPSLDARADKTLGARFALTELLRFGCTTAVPIGPSADELLPIADALGLRMYVSPAFKSADYCVGDDGRLAYDWNEPAGLAGLERAKAFIAKYAGAQNGRVQGMLFPYQIDTCSPALLKATRKAADELRVGVEIHAGQNLLEFHEMLRRHGRTPVEHLADTGLLGPDLIIGHCLISTSHSLAAVPGGRDLALLANSGTSVAHCPLVFARRGNALESFQRYRERGINLGLGTDTYPRDLISEMRWASLVGKIVERDFLVATSADVFTAATLGGARALRRDDLGRLAPGAKADIVVVDLRKLRIGPYRDPIKALVQCATGDDVERVIVDGRTVVENGQVLGVDERQLLADAQREAERLWSTVPEWHWQKWTADELSPQSFSSLDRDLGRQSS